jgi:hypothetical protein
VLPSVAIDVAPSAPQVAPFGTQAPPLQAKPAAQSTSPVQIVLQLVPPQTYGLQLVWGPQAPTPSQTDAIPAAHPHEVVAPG